MFVGVSVEVGLELGCGFSIDGATSLASSSTLTPRDNDKSDKSSNDNTRADADTGRCCTTSPSC